LNLPWRWTPARILFAFLGWMVFLAWLRPLALPDEGRYVGVAWEMLRSGDWRVPTLNGLPFFHKPPLFYWITAGALQLFGVHPLAARVAPLLGAWLAGASLYWLLRRRADEATARAALLVLATLPFFYAGAQYANLDMLVAGCITATLAAAADTVLALQAGEPHRRSLLLTWTFTALGLLAKGLIGIVLPGAVLLLWLLATRRLRLVWRFFWWPGPLLMLLIAAPWFLAMQQRFPDFLHYFFIYQHFQRFSGSGFNNVQPFWFYGPVVLLLSLPWSLGLWRSARARPALGAPGQGLNALMVVWLLVIVGFFSLPSSKLIGYVLPVLPPLAALLAVAWRRGRGDLATLPRGLLAGAAVLCLVAIVAAALLDKASNVPLAKVLREQRQPGESLLMVGRYAYDLPVLLQEAAPVPVVTDWQDPGRLATDSWEKELADAGEFAADRAHHTLINLADLRSTLCAHEVTWVVLTGTPRDELAGFPELAHTRSTRLLKLDLRPAAARAALCGQTPTSG
jgi:4-amino-4-deoxy-L-arabinose transferase-like glycosyltransferase